jgi:hypothetical protein
MTTKALLVKLEAKPGKENEVAKFLRDGQGLVQQEPATHWRVFTEHYARTRARVFRTNSDTKST